MQSRALFVLAALVFGYAMVSRRLSRSGISGPMLFTFAGIALGAEYLGWVDAGLGNEGVRRLLEISLALVLFTDATEVPVGALRSEVPLAGRMLAVGLPLTMAFGTAVAALMFTDLSFGEAAIIGVLLSPTDAALGQAVVANERVPMSIRQALTIESGLNDGLAVPFFAVAVALAEFEFHANGSFLIHLPVDLAIAIALGVAAGWLGGKALAAASIRGWVGHSWPAISAAALAVTTFELAQGLGVSGFIAAFVAGLTFGRVTRDRLPLVTTFSDAAAQLLTMLSFFTFGSAILAGNLVHADARVVVYAVLSLTVIRMVPVALSLFGEGLGWQTISYLGWFGPRGLASIVFATTAVTESVLPHEGTIMLVMAVTVTLSVYLHGATAWIGSNRYADWWARRRERVPEMAESRPVSREVRRGRFEM